MLMATVMGGWDGREEEEGMECRLFAPDWLSSTSWLPCCWELAGRLSSEAWLWSRTSGMELAN
jgi:hypothetical protein